MIGEPLDVIGAAIGVEALDGPRDAGVELSAALLQEARVRHVVGQRVLEGVLEIREQAVS